MCRTSVLTVMFGVVSVRIVSCTYSDYSHYILLPFGLKSFKNYQKCYMQALLLISVSCFFFSSIIIHIKECLVTGMSDNSVSVS